MRSRRLALHPVMTNIQTSWVKMGRDGAAACLRAGANDLGGTLMNESITRAAGARARRGDAAGNYGGNRRCGWQAIATENNALRRRAAGKTACIVRRWSIATTGMERR